MTKFRSHIRNLIELCVGFHDQCEMTMQEIQESEYLRGQVELICDFSELMEIRDLLEPPIREACFLASYGNDPKVAIDKAMEHIELVLA